jgi:hypothetical protein
MSKPKGKEGKKKSDKTEPAKTKKEKRADKLVKKKEKIRIAAEV